MNTAKIQKKQTAAAVPQANKQNNVLLDEAILDLEDVCVRLLETRFAVRDDSERMYLQQRFKNIVTPVSLALSEVRGPRRFHNHYRHDERDESILVPVLENPIDMIAHACQHALQESAKKLSGIHDDDLLIAQRRLEKSLNNFLLKYRQVNELEIA